MKDKPEMPERIWAKDFPEAKQPTGKMGGWVEWSDTTQTAYLRADKVRELVNQFINYTWLVSLAGPMGHAENLRQLCLKLHELGVFPEGVEGKEEK